MRYKKILVLSFIGIALVAGMLAYYFLWHERQVDLVYFYDPRCPNCRAVEPYISLLEKELKKKDIHFERCSVPDVDTCSVKARFILYTIYPKGNIRIPTVGVKHSKNISVFIGRLDVIKVGSYLNKNFGVPEVKAQLQDVNYPVEECLKCHQERNIKPPSTYTCTYCCHNAKK